MKKLIVMLFIISAMFTAVSAQDAAVSYNEGVQAMNNGNFQAAIDNFKAAALADPAHLDCRVGLAGAYLKTNQWENAEIAAREAVQLAPENEPALDLLAKSFYMQKKYGDSAAVLEKLNSINPTAQGYALQGKAYYNLKNYTKVATSFEKALEMGHDDTGDLRRLADAYYKLYKSQKNSSMFTSAIAALDKAAEIKPESDTFYYKGKFLYFKKQYEEAAGALKQAAELKANDNIYYYLSNSLYKLKNYDEALQFGTKLLAMKKSSKAYALLGDIARDAGDNGSAMEYYKAGAAYSDKKGQYCAQYYKYMQSQGQ